MSKSKSKPATGGRMDAKPAMPPNAAAPAKNAASSGQRGDGMRETIESVVIAFVLAFLFKTFEAEAFVIPTGSMAPTLMGRHKDIDCGKCGFEYQVGASSEMNKPGTYLVGRLLTSVCPNCGYQEELKDLPVFKGDRILVNKFPYEFCDPDRWDVVVFKYPEEPQTNYIKRLVGLPGEALRIERGNVYARQGETEEFQILRKPPAKQKELQLTVYDDDHPPWELIERGWPERWVPMQQDDRSASIAGWSEAAADEGWQRQFRERTYHLKAAAQQELHWLRYRHIVPSPSEWRMPGAAAADPKPQLITDVCGYNTYTSTIGTHSWEDALESAQFWVGDLTLTATVQIDASASGGELLLELVEGVRRYRCRVDVATGKAVILYVDDHLDPDAEEEVVLAEAETTLRGAGRYRVRFANVDDRLCLWVDGQSADFGEKGEYAPPAHAGPQRLDLIPAGIAARNVDAILSHLLVERDIYYRSEQVPNDSRGNDSPEREYHGGTDLAELVYNPEAWWQEYSQNASSAEFLPLGPDEFFMLGDNSPESADSRLWPNNRASGNRHAVPRKALVGKAFFIYWPHGQPFLNGGQGFSPDVPLLDRFFYHWKETEVGPRLTEYPEVRIPFYPQFDRMQRIR